MSMNKKSQVWVETVVYIFIAIAIIAGVLAVAVPKINQASDKAVIYQTIDSLSLINEKMRDVIRSFEGNTRDLSLQVKKGEYIIDPNQSSISYLLKNTGYEYSEPDFIFKQGDIIRLTTQRGEKNYDILFILNYSNNNIVLTYEGKSELRTISPAPAIYKILIENKGENSENKTQINILQI